MRFLFLNFLNVYLAEENGDGGSGGSGGDADPAASVAGMVGDTGGGEAGGQGGDRPEWLPEKFWNDETKTGNFENLAKSYGELEGKLGNYTGAPDEYAIGISEELKSQGVELDKDHPLVDLAVEYAKKAGMNQEGFTGLMDIAGKYALALHGAEVERVNKEIASLGDNGDRRLHNLSQWSDRNLSPELSDAFKEMLTTAGGVKAAEKIISMTRTAPMQADAAGAAATGISAEEVRKMQFEKDEYGNRRIGTDPEFRREYERKRDLLYGTDEFRQIVGGSDN